MGNVPELSTAPEAGALLPDNAWGQAIREGYAAFTDAYQKAWEDKGADLDLEDTEEACTVGVYTYVANKSDPDLLRLLIAAIEGNVSAGRDWLGYPPDVFLRRDGNMREEIRENLATYLDEAVWALYDHFLARVTTGSPGAQECQVEGEHGGY